MAGLGSVFFDEESGFQLRIHFEPVFSDISAVVAEQGAKIAKALDLIKRMESGEVVNHTSNVKESEDRQVDHYNLRLAEEKVKGKSLGHTLAIWKDVLAFAESIRAAGTINTIIFNGIGGSYLGPLMMIVAKYGVDYNTTAGLPFKIHFISNTDPDAFTQATKGLDLAKAIMVHLSKSGTTSETAGNMKTWIELVTKAGLPVGPHNAAVTIKGSLLDKIAAEKGFVKSWHMEVDTGGRTSVCSAIGMVPSAFAQLDYEGFIKGMSYMDTLTRREAENPAALLASVIYKLNTTIGFKNMIVLGYSEFLKEYAHYLQQLYMESLGKEYTVDGTVVHVGQTLFGGVGTGEQHAFLQQTQKGVGDAFVRLIGFEKRATDFANEQAGSMGRQLLAFFQGTQKALLQNKRPFISQLFRERNEFALGMMIAFEERIVTFLASFMDINAYDQPGVQDGKLAASDVNKLSAQIVAGLAKKAAAGNAAEILAALEIGGAHYEAEAILNDIFHNHEVANAYPELVGIKASRVFDKASQQFKFTFSK